LRGEGLKLSLRYVELIQFSYSGSREINRGRYIYMMGLDNIWLKHAW